MGTLMTTEANAHRASTLVWIDAREAVIIRMQGDRARIERVESEVPAHHRATGHVRHDPAIRHGGGGPQSAGEPHRIEHLNRFVGDIANRLAADDDLLVLGPGTVHERLARHLSERDGHHGRHRVIDCQASPRLTDRQLISRLRRSRAANRESVRSERTAGASCLDTTDRARCTCRVASSTSRRASEKEKGQEGRSVP